MSETLDSTSSRDMSAGSRSSAVYRRASPTASESCSTSFWGTTAMSSLRASKWVYRSSPFRVSIPASGGFRPLRIASSVDFPDPLGPSTQTNSLGRMTRLI